VKLVGLDQRVDAGDVHLHDAAGADVEVADFAVAHLAVGQADEVVAGLDQRVGILAQQLVVGGLFSQGDGVVGGFGAVAPSVKDGKKERTLGSGHEKDTSIGCVIFFSRINRRGGEGCAGTHSSAGQSCRRLAITVSFRWGRASRKCKREKAGALSLLLARCLRSRFWDLGYD
jgi:hypothetical protein